jgi:hypothetical protein
MPSSKIFDNHLSRANVVALVRDPRICPVLLERTNKTAQWCSLQNAHLRHDWFLANKTRARACVRDPAIDGLASYTAAQDRWYAFVLATLRREGIPFLGLTFDLAVQQRTRALQFIRSFCDPRQTPQDNNPAG